MGAPGLLRKMPQGRPVRPPLDPAGPRMLQGGMSKAGPSPAKKPLSAAAERALAEAAARRAALDARVAAAPKEIDGPRGPEPVRYGDWERKGIASDF